MNLEKKNRVISIISAIITVISLVVIVLLLVNYLNVKAENDQLRSQLEQTNNYETFLPEKIELEGVIIDYA
ncbi:MAG: hypothetical protein WCR63_01820 [Bacilli bacterium]